MTMQDIKETQTTQSQNEATDTQRVLPTWVPPKIEVYNEKDLLKAVPALGDYDAAA
jgi:hypothetical protein